ncbi:hypothetical protein BD779DRAFT_1034539 [Infundibulicybe gibba]|nr:hypothetical protein BD779DRAFT_1034539 [Infundibulicybe gibba]
MACPLLQSLTSSFLLYLHIPEALRRQTNTHTTSLLGVIPCATAFQQSPKLRQVKFTFAAHTLDLADFNLLWNQSTYRNMPSCSLCASTSCGDVLRSNVYIFLTRSDDLQRIRAFSHWIRRPLQGLRGAHACDASHKVLAGLDRLVRRSGMLASTGCDFFYPGTNFYSTR